MNLQVAQNILTLLEQFNIINFDELVEKAFADRKDFENIQLNQMNLAEFIFLSEKIFKQFQTEFTERENTVILPLIYVHGQYGSAQIDSQITQYFALVNQPNFTQAENILLWLVGYQVENGFYNKHSKKIAETVSSNLLLLSEKLKLIELDIQNRQKQNEGLNIGLETTKKDIESFVIHKQEELKQITTNLATTNTQTTQINELLTKGTEQSSRLNTILEQQEQNKILADRKLQDLQELYGTINTKLNENEKVIFAQIEEFKKQTEINEGHLKFIEGKRSFFDERITYLENLIGREVGASLFETFKQRKLELNNPVLFWRWAVPIMSFATVAWIFFLFYHQPEITNINSWWEAFAVNTLKSIPAVFLLLFSINQYRKERNFQEEYAFKSAVALTIDAYSSRLSDKANKDKLIMEAVLGVYLTPIEEKHFGKIKNKAMLESFKTMVETVRDLTKTIK